MLAAAAPPVWFRRTALVAFFAMQLLDGGLTYTGVMAFGPTVEANPIVSTYMSILGPGTGLIAVKVFASACAILLYLNGRHRPVAALALLYCVAAVGPWMTILSTQLF